MLDVMAGHQRCALTSDTDLCIRYRTKDVSVRLVVRDRITFFLYKYIFTKTFNLMQAQRHATDYVTGDIGSNPWHSQFGLFFN